MIGINTLISVFVIIGLYIFTTFIFVPKIRKNIKILCYTCVFIGLLFPMIKSICGVKLGLETYAIIVSGIELFEMILKQYVENKMKNNKEINKRIKKIYDSM